MALAAAALQQTLIVEGQYIHILPLTPHTDTLNTLRQDCKLTPLRSAHVRAHVPHQFYRNAIAVRLNVITYSYLKHVAA